MSASLAKPRVAKLALAHRPTPIERYPALDALVGTEVWIKRDDATGGADAGNKIRKLEYLMAGAQQARAQVVITCGAVQSNHARATAIAARRLGMQPELFLREEADAGPRRVEGNLLLDTLLGAELTFIDRAAYGRRDALMAERAQRHADAGRRAFVIPEGGSNGLGALGYWDAMAETRAQLDAAAGELPDRFDAVLHACGSGGTAAGAVLGAGACEIASEVIAVAVCDDRAYFEARITSILTDAEGYFSAPPPRAALRVLDAYKGPAYGVPSSEQISFIRETARRTGLLLDPVYSGKALFALAQLPDKPARVLFIHTGGLPGLLAEHARFTHDA
ncbi:MAG: pyridoxal-phosphate dependent enzyme [Polyangiales bacterium]